MESKSIILTKKLYKYYKGNSPISFYQKLKTESHLKALYDNLPTDEIVFLCLMIGNMRENTDAQKLYNEIKSNLFVFSIVEVTSDESTTECSECTGSGEIDCYECNGEGEIECSLCDGDGKDSEGYTCDDCGGDGTKTCDNCVRGYQSCDNCEGSGEQTLYGYQDITQYFFVSYDKKLFSYLETKEEIMDEISDENMNKIFTNKKSFITYEVYGNSEEFGDNSIGDYIFVGLDKEEVSFFKDRYNLNPRGIVSYT